MCSSDLLERTACRAAPLHERAAAPVRAAVDAALHLSVAGSPFEPDAAAPHDRIAIRLGTDEAAILTVTIRSWEGRPVRTLASAEPVPAGETGWTWEGREDRGRIVPDGPYRLVVRADFPDRSATLDRLLAKAPVAPYDAAPGAILVAINAGHGGPDPGAVYAGKRESDANLEIALKLRDMLLASGIRVLMTRTKDVAIDVPLRDVSGNGVADHADELIARNDIVNLARADLEITTMNNAAGCHCARGTESYTNAHRTWSPEGTDLARFIQAAHLRVLAPFASAAWTPIDRGVRFYDFSSVRPYHRTEMPRPVLAPSVLIESLYMDHRNELHVLTRPEVRTVLSGPDAVGSWPFSRPVHVVTGCNPHNLVRDDDTNAAANRALGVELVRRDARFCPCDGASREIGRAHV